jgi:hypothetical protein
MSLEIGDLVMGKKPWNQDTYLGVVVDTRLEQSYDTFRIFWLNREDNKLIPEKRAFLSWEIPNSVKRIDNVKRK